MTDLFDRVAMRVLGSQANLRPRRRTRFEPMAGPDIVSTADPAPSRDRVSAIEDDPLAASATVVERAQSIAPPRIARAAGSAIDPNTRPTASSAPVDDAPVPFGEQKPPAATFQQAGTPEAVKAASENADAEAQPIPPPLPRVPEAPAVIEATARPVVDHQAVAARSSPERSHVTVRAAVDIPETGDVVTPTVAIGSMAAAAPALSRSHDPVAASPAPPPSYRVATSESPILTDIVPSSSPPPDPAPFADPLGVRARARIEQRPSRAPDRPYAAPPSTPPPVEVTIGRLEIRAESAAAPSGTTRPFEPHLDLAAYRARKEGKA